MGGGEKNRFAAAVGFGVLMTFGCSDPIDPAEATFTAVQDYVIRPRCGPCHYGNDFNGFCITESPAFATGEGERWDVSRLVNAPADTVDPRTGDPWTIVVPYDPTSSLLYVIVQDDPDGDGPSRRMPAEGCGSDESREPISEDEVQRIRDWIRIGAPDN